MRNDSPKLLIVDITRMSISAYPTRSAAALHLPDGTVATIQEHTRPGDEWAQFRLLLGALHHYEVLKDIDGQLVRTRLGLHVPATGITTCVHSGSTLAFRTGWESIPREGHIGQLTDNDPPTLTHAGTTYTPYLLDADSTQQAVDCYRTVHP